jgi:hypothetical protein
MINIIGYMRDKSSSLNPPFINAIIIVTAIKIKIGIPNPRLINSIFSSYVSYYPS